MNHLAGIRAVLIDLEGVVFQGDQPVPGAVEAINALAAAGIKRRFLTNTTTRSRAQLQKKLNHMGLSTGPQEVISPAAAACRFIAETSGARAHLVVRDALKTDFASLRLSDTNPDFIVIGDIGPTWDYALLNRLYRMLFKGARLVALHKYRYAERGDGPELDIGPFVAALEYASGKAAHVMGKPSPHFFHNAVADLQLEPHEIVMIGDDVEADVGGAKAAGYRGYLVQTGKFHPNHLARAAIKPDAVLGSIADLSP